jgi:hypothetical protein
MKAISKFFSDLFELIAVLILVPLALMFKLLVVIGVFAFICSPLILIGFLVWVIAR